MSLDVFQGDDGLDETLFSRLLAEGKEVVSCASAEGWGHHSGAVITWLDGGYYLTSGSGCSCGGTADIDGPFPTARAAATFVGGDSGDLLRLLDAQWLPPAPVGSDAATAVEIALDMLVRGLLAISAWGQQ